MRIIDILREEKRFRKHYLELLITQQLSILDLSREGDEIAGYLQLASIRCSVISVFSFKWCIVIPTIHILNLQNLKTLRLSGCQKISKQVYQNFMPLFDKLQVVDFSNTTAGDTCLFILGAYCKDLRYSLFINLKQAIKL